MPTRPPSPDAPQPPGRAELTAQVLMARWDVLEPHHQREALLVLKPDLDLVDAGLALALDRTDRVRAWLAVGRMGRPDHAAVEGFRQAQARFQVLIVQPWVLAQVLPEPSPAAS